MRIIDTVVVGAGFAGLAMAGALRRAGRDDVIVMVGGAPVTQEYADAAGADGYAADASGCVRKAKDLLKTKRAKVLA